jgi:1-deoxy-D-xylulose-5-phosphate reductoisomerase
MAIEVDQAKPNEMTEPVSRPSRRIAILGATGSIGRQCFNVVESLEGHFEVVSMAAGTNVELAAEQAARHKPKIVSVASEEGRKELIERMNAAGVAPLPEILFGNEGMEAVATIAEADTVVSAAVGVVGLKATYKAVLAGKKIALANKEVLVAAGEIVTAAADQRGGEIIPVDSEHNAIHQCLRAGEHEEVRRLVLTASGGPFRTTPIEELARVKPEQALSHPNWKMGRRITIDSATMMNKGFEVIEARWLFGFGLDQIDVVIHPQSTVHSLVEFVDGSVLAQLGPTDMRMPLQYALTYPLRVPSNGFALDWAKLGKLEFEPVPLAKFPSLGLARKAASSGGILPCALNAADEEAVGAFLGEELEFTGIAEVIDAVLQQIPNRMPLSIEDVLEADGQARRMAREEIENRRN